MNIPNTTKFRTIRLICFVGFASLALGYVIGLRDGGRHMKALYDCGNDRECITAAGGNADVILK